MRLMDRAPRETARDYATRVIRDNIIKTVLEPGYMVSENELAAELGVSRTPVREALIELSKTGVVEIYPQHGSMVARIDWDKVEEAIFTRRVLETAVVQEVCRMAREEDLHALEENLSIQRLYLERGDVEKLLATDNDFHQTLFAIARKNVSYDLLAGLGVHLDRVRHLSMVAVRLERVFREHEEILDAIRNRNVEKAVAVMTVHLTHYQLDTEDIREKYPHYFAG